MKNVLYVVIPEVFRPVTYLPEVLKNTIKNGKGLIYVLTRMFEEDFSFNRPLMEWCKQNKVKWVYAIDAKVNYLKEGIGADYKVVEEKTYKVKNILENSEKIHVTSDLGSEVTFKLYHNSIRPRIPHYTDYTIWNQAPEGEVMTGPIPETFNGTVVIDGPVTGLGEPSSPVAWEFKNGQAVDVKGDEMFLQKLLDRIRVSDPRVTDLRGIWIAEFSVGTNEWAKFDENISNSEKVAGGIHFGMGNSEGLGPDRGERFHFDSIVKKPTVVVTLKDGSELTLIESGKLKV